MIESFHGLPQSSSHAPGRYLKLFHPLLPHPSPHLSLYMLGLSASMLITDDVVKQQLNNNCKINIK